MEPVVVIITLVVLAAIAVGVYLFLRNRKAQNEETTETTYDETQYEPETVNEEPLPEVPTEDRPETVEVTNPAPATTIGTAEVTVTKRNGSSVYKPSEPRFSAPAPTEAVTSPASTAAVFGTAVVVEDTADKNVATESSDVAQVNTTDTTSVSSTDGGSTSTN